MAEEMKSAGPNTPIQPLADIVVPLGRARIFDLPDQETRQKAEIEKVIFENMKVIVTRDVLLFHFCKALTDKFKASQLKAVKHMEKWSISQNEFEHRNVYINSFLYVLHCVLHQECPSREPYFEPNQGMDYIGIEHDNRILISENVQQILKTFGFIDVNKISFSENVKQFLKTAEPNKSVGQIQFFEKSFEICENMFRKFKTSGINATAICFEAAHQFYSRYYSSSLIHSYTAIEMMLQLLYNEKIWKANSENGGHTHINSKRKSKLNSKEFSSSVVLEILSLDNVICDKKYQRITKVRNVRNNFVHKGHFVNLEEAKESLALMRILSFQTMKVPRTGSPHAGDDRLFFHRKAVNDQR